MSRRFFALAILALAACGGKEGGDEIYRLSRDPVSVRGWILDVKGAPHGETMEMELARRTQLFQSTSVWVEDVQYASGGIAENGAFIVLDVPPMKAVLGFNAPGAETAKVVLEGVPAQADVIIPDLILESGGATVLDPKKIVIRLPTHDVDKPTLTDKTAKVMGYTVPITQMPVSAMTDRREYPQVPGFRPVATVK